MTRRTLRQPAAALGIAALIIAGATVAWSAQPPRDGRVRLAQAAASPTTDAADWQKVSGPEQSFSADMPGGWLTGYVQHIKFTGVPCNTAACSNEVGTTYVETLYANGERKLATPLEYCNGGWRLYGLDTCAC